MNRKRLMMAVAGGGLLCLTAFLGVKHLYLSPNAWEADVLRFVSTRIQRQGVDDQLGEELRALSETTPIYVTEVDPGQREGAARILSANLKTAIGSDLASFWDQQSSWYVSSGPVSGPGGRSYMVYVSK